MSGASGAGEGGAGAGAAVEVATQEYSTVKDLVGFLLDSRKEVRGLAARNVAALTGNAGDRALLQRAEAAGPLVRLIGDSEPVVGSYAVRALVNLSAEPGFQGQILALRVVNRVMEAIQRDACPFRGLAVMFLSNLCATPAGCMQLLQKDEHGGRLVGLHLRQLLRLFLLEGGESASGSDEMAYASLVLQSVTQLEDARSILTNPERGLVELLLGQLRSPSLVRRRGVAGTFKHLCFDKAFATAVLGSKYKKDVVVQLARPLVGPEPVPAERRKGMPAAWIELGRGKKRETDPATRRSLVEALVLLGSHDRMFRERFRAIKLYEVLRRLHVFLEGTTVEAAESEMRAMMGGGGGGEGEGVGGGEGGGEEGVGGEGGGEEGEGGGEMEGYGDKGVVATEDSLEKVRVRVAREEAAIREAGLFPNEAALPDDEDAVPREDSEVPLPPDDEATVRSIIELVNLIHRDEAPRPKAPALPDAPVPSTTEPTTTATEEDADDHSPSALLPSSTPSAWDEVRPELPPSHTATTHVHPESDPAFDPSGLHDIE